MSGKLHVEWLGTDVPYRDAMELQDARYEAVRRNESPDTLFLLEHAPVYTLGRSARRENVLWGAALRAEKGIELVETSRGGDVTYHGPGQLVGYPVLKLRERGMGVIDYVTALEEVVIRALHDLGCAEAGRDKRNRGVWVGNSKICAIGVRISTGITRHGFALNVATRLEDFRGIVPCGLTDASVVSLERLLGEKVDKSLVRERVVENFVAVFGYDDVEKPGF